MNRIFAAAIQIRCILRMITKSRLGMYKKTQADLQGLHKQEPAAGARGHLEDDVALLELLAPGRFERRELD